MRIKKSLRNRFTPYFSTAINGTAVKLTIKQMEANPEKYINTPLVDMYENPDAIKLRIAKAKKRGAKKINMAGPNVKRGYSFDKDYQSPKAKAIEAFRKASSVKTKRLKDKHEASQKADAEAKKKADAEAKKTAKAAKEKADAKAEAAAKAEDEAVKNALAKEKTK